MVFKRSADAIVITDTKGIGEANPAFGTALGYLPEEMKGCSVLDFSPELQEDGVLFSHRRDGMLEEIMGGRQISTRWDALSKDGQTVCFELQGGLVNILGKTMVILVGRNVTELIHLKQQQREALDQIEGNLTDLDILNNHIRNPLMIISGYTEMSASEHTPVIMSQIQEIDGIIKTLDQGFLESEFGIFCAGIMMCAILVVSRPEIYSECIILYGEHLLSYGTWRIRAMKPTCWLARLPSEVAVFGVLRRDSGAYPASLQLL